jgi:hypothetical protein
MKNIIFSIVILILLFVSACNEQANQPNPVEPKDTIKYSCPSCPDSVPFDDVNQCPLPFDPNDPLGRGNVPTFEHDANGPSVNGDLIVIGFTTLLNIKTLQRIEVNPFEIIPKEYNIIGGYIPCFSPKNNNKILLEVGANIKNELGKVVYGRLLFIVDFNTNEFTNITPTKFGIAGDETLWGYSGVDGWSYDETSKTDRIHFSDIHGTYILQEDRFIDIPTTQTKGLRVSPNGRYIIKKLWNFDIPGEIRDKYLLNEIPFQLEKGFARGESAAFSKDSRYLAISGTAERIVGYSDKEHGSTIWIYDLHEYVPNSTTFSFKYKINPRRLFCKYLWTGGSTRNLAFISPNTLAIALQDHTGGGAKVHEITIDGKYVRQLTFEK